MDVKEAIKVIKEAIKSDPEYRESWKATIATCFQDEYDQTPKEDFTLHRVSNRAADRFLDMLCL